MGNAFRSVRGFNDVLPDDAALWRRVNDTATAVFDAYGYREIRLPVLEASDLFARSIGEATDVVEKEMFTFQDRDGSPLTLRPEGTAGCVRAGLEHGLLHNQRQRLWYSGPMFRHERPQAGRYRQFHQFGVEAFGIAGPEADLEVIAMSARLLRGLGLEGVELRLNSLGESATRARFRAALLEYLGGRADALDADSRRRLDTNPLRILDSKVPATREILSQAPKLTDFLDAAARAHFDAVRAGLDDLGIAYVVDPGIVRGLDYYTRTVFEWVTDRLGAQGTVCAGGRYDGLVEALGGTATPAAGWAAGIERLVLLMQQGEAAAPAGGAQVWFCWQGDDAGRAAMGLAERLRDERPGLRVVLDGGGKLASQLKRADRSGAAAALVLGDAEAASRKVQVKSLREPAGADLCAWDGLAARLSGLLDLD